MRNALLLLSLCFFVGCDNATEEERIAFIQKRFNTVEVASVSNTSPIFIVRDSSNQFWQVSVDAKPEVQSAIILFSAEVSDKPFLPPFADDFSVEKPFSE